MATTIKLKNSVTTTNAPSSLVQGEVAINITDKKVWVGNAATTPIQLLGDGGSVNFTTVDTTNLQVTNIKAKDGTASATIANSTGVMTIASSVLTTTDINGGTIDGTAIGGSTAAAGAFTTLSASGVATFSAGTVSAPAITTTGDTNTGIFFPAADTIAFTEGGVEAMRIDSSGNVGIGTASPAFISGGGLEVYNSSVTRIKLTNSTSGTTSFDGLDIVLSSTDANIIVREAFPLLFYTSAAERMRITSGGDVLVGTTSVSQSGVTSSISKNGGSGFNAINSNAGTATYSNFQLGNANSANRGGMALLGSAWTTSGIIRQDGVYAYANGAGGLTVATEVAQPLYFATNNTERMRLDSSGNLGLGVTPSAWSVGKAFEVGFLGAGVFSPSQTITNIVNNTYYSSGAYRYATTNAAAYFGVNTGTFQWFTAPSGTAGNTITFTQAMTLDASGNLLVGITSARANAGDVQVSKGISFPATQSAQSDANTLDDYEEGDWTPVLAGSSGTSGQSYSRQKGKYTKVGRLVTCTFDVVLTAVGTVSGEARITGLPFTVASDEGFRSGLSVGEFSNLAANYVQFGGVPLNSTTQIHIRALTAAAATSTAPNATSAWTNTTQVIGTFSYFV